MKHPVNETTRAVTLLVIAAFPTLALLGSLPSHATSTESSRVASAVAVMPAASAVTAAAALDEKVPAASERDTRRERRCEHVRRIGKVSHTRCE
jgi:hypothetical protein